MSVHYENEIAALKHRLLTMAGHAEAAVARAVRALNERDDDLANQVEQDDSILDRLEVEIDDMVVTLLAKAPLATELRTIIAVMKIAHELERVGDTATTIARRARELNQEPQLKPQVDIPRLAEIGRAMLKDALDAFVNRDPAKAQAVIPRDKEVDALNKQFHRELAGCIVERPATITPCLHLMTVSKSLERIADHAKNVAEDVVYLYEGRDIRHPGANPEEPLNR